MERLKSLNDQHNTEIGEYNWRTDTAEYNWRTDTDTIGGLILQWSREFAIVERRNEGSGINSRNRST